MSLLALFVPGSSSWVWTRSGDTDRDQDRTRTGPDVEARLSGVSGRQFLCSKAKLTKLAEGGSVRGRYWTLNQSSVGTRTRRLDLTLSSDRRCPSKASIGKAVSTSLFYKVKRWNRHRWLVDASLERQLWLVELRVIDTLNGFCWTWTSSFSGRLILVLLIIFQLIVGSWSFPTPHILSKPPRQQDDPVSEWPL